MSRPGPRPAEKFIKRHIGAYNRRGRKRPPLAQRHCRRCGVPFTGRGYNCPTCTNTLQNLIQFNSSPNMENAIYYGEFYTKGSGVMVTRDDGLHFRNFARLTKKLRAAADRSGAPKIYSAGQYSQEFLRSLILR